MKKLILIAPALLLFACESEVSEDPVATETGGAVTGDVLESSISDDMLPLEGLTSTSPPAERTATTTVTSSSNGSTTTVETTVTTSSDGAEAAPAPTPPEPPAAPEQ